LLTTCFDGRALGQKVGKQYLNQMDALLEELIAKNKPVQDRNGFGTIIRSAPPRFCELFDLLISYDENGAEHFAIVPLLTITAAMARA
jgi:hypothetical protein